MGNKNLRSGQEDIINVSLDENQSVTADVAFSTAIHSITQEHLKIIPSWLIQQTSMVEIIKQLTHG